MRDKADNRSGDNTYPSIPFRLYREALSRCEQAKRDNGKRDIPVI